MPEMTVAHRDVSAPPWAPLHGPAFAERYRGDWSTIHEGDALSVAACEPADSFSLAIFDGAYGMRKAEWDKVSLDDLAEWYRPHFEAADRILAPSASLYVWNTAAGWARLDPVLRAMGWTQQALIIWDKGEAAITSYHARPEDWRSWKEVTEVCGFYQREAWAPSTCAGSEIAYAAGADDRNTARIFLVSEWEATGLRRRDADRAMGTNGMAGHYFGTSQWSLPTWEAYQQLATYAQEHGTPRTRPYLVLPKFADLRASYDHLRASYDHLRAEYEASRPAFDCPIGVSNVWRHGQVTGKERIRAGDGSSLYPCQKPLTFADRMIRASTRPGERVWVPFGHSCREAVACERMGRQGPAEGRYCVTAELNQDGPDYIGAVLPSLRFEAPQMAGPQRGLFGGAV